MPYGHPAHQKRRRLLLQRPVLSAVASLLLCLSLDSNFARADTITVAVAANFAPTLQELTRHFQQHSAHRVRLVSGSSGLLAAQIRHGAPYDVFFSADASKPQALQADGLAKAHYSYAIGRLVLWSARPTKVIMPVQAAQLCTTRDTCQSSLRHTLQQDFRHIALANPRLAPYGLAAVETLASLGLQTATKARWVLAENIAQSYLFISSGNAELGFIARAQWQAAKPSGQAWLIPSDWHHPIAQEALLLNERSASREFWQFMRTDAVREHIRRAGYDAPELTP